MSLTEEIRTDVTALEGDAKAETGVLFDKAKVDIREELPVLMSKLGIDTSDESTVIHSSLTLIFKLLKEYGPGEVRLLLAGI